VGQYAVDRNYFATAYSSGPLQVPANGGVYGYGPAGTFPRGSYAGSNYWVDVVLAPTSGPRVSMIGTATGQGAAALAIGALNFGDDTTGPAAGGDPSASDGVVRIRWRR
jgi:hypothetical protein